MKKEAYERLYMDVTQFDTEDVITTSGESEPMLHTGFSELGIGEQIDPNRDSTGVIPYGI